MFKRISDNIKRQQRKNFPWRIYYWATSCISDGAYDCEELSIIKTNEERSRIEIRWQGTLVFRAYFRDIGAITVEEFRYGNAWYDHLTDIFAAKESGIKEDEQARFEDLD